MSRLREQLLQRYDRHCSRVSDEVPGQFLPKASWLLGLERTFGHLIAGLPEGSPVLDLGCGSGSLLYWLSQHPEVSPIGVDLSLQQVKIARSRLSDLEIHHLDGLDFLKSRHGEFAGIFCLDVLEHIQDPDDYLLWLGAAQTALAPGGFFCCRVPNAANLTGSYSRYLDLTHERIFTSTSIVQLLEAAGFSAVEVLPIRAADWQGWFRIRLEHFVHRIVFRLCGRGLERVFTSNICAVGYGEQQSAGALLDSTS